MRPDDRPSLGSRKQINCTDNHMTGIQDSRALRGMQAGPKESHHDRSAGNMLIQLHNWPPFFRAIQANLREVSAPKQTSGSPSTRELQGSFDAASISPLKD